MQKYGKNSTYTYRSTVNVCDSRGRECDSTALLSVESAKKSLDLQGFFDCVYLSALLFLLCASDSVGSVFFGFFIIDQNSIITCAGIPTRYTSHMFEPNVSAVVWITARVDHVSREMIK